jgi:hypothetical protein
VVLAPLVAAAGAAFGVSVVSLLASFRSDSNPVVVLVACAYALDFAWLVAVGTLF